MVKIKADELNGKRLIVKENIHVPIGMFSMPFVDSVLGGLVVLKEGDKRQQFSLKHLNSVYDLYKKDTEHNRVQFEVEL